MIKFPWHGGLSLCKVLNNERGVSARKVKTLTLKILTLLTPPPLVFHFDPKMCQAGLTSIT